MYGKEEGIRTRQVYSAGSTYLITYLTTLLVQLTSKIEISERVKDINIIPVPIANAANALL